MLLHDSPIYRHARLYGSANVTQAPQSRLIRCHCVRAITYSNGSRVMLSSVSACHFAKLCEIDTTGLARTGQCHCTVIVTTMPG